MVILEFGVEVIITEFSIAFSEKIKCSSPLLLILCQLFLMTISGFSDSSLRPSVTCLFKLLCLRTFGFAVSSHNFKAL